MLSQPQYAPLRLADEVALVHGLQAGLLDRLPLERIARLRAELPAWLDRMAGAAVAAIQQSGQLDDAGRAALEKCVAALVAELSPAAAAADAAREPG